MRKKIFTFLLALAASVGLMNAAVDGKLPGAFTVDGSGTQVYFSQGNLQYVGGNWQFAENQWDVIGASQTNSSRDLFGWGTGNNPNQTSMQYGDYSTFADWGSNMGGDWRTLTRDEWLYIFDTRTSASALRGSATVCGVHGYIILPDNFVLPGGLSWTPRPDDWTTNVYTSQEWSSMEENGAVFLPVTGYRAGTTVIYDESSWGYYWSATEHSQAYNAYNVWVADEDDNVKVFYRSRTFGQSVRLVSETAPGGSTLNPSGECGAQGNNLLWELNTSTGVLTITGSGAMNDWPDDTKLPWYDNRNQITSVVLPSGITSIGTKAFRGCTNLASINMTENYPAGLTAINQEAFCHTALTSVTIPESVVIIGQDAFYQSQSITDVYCYADPNNLAWNDFWCDDFNKTSPKSTQCHVKDCYLAVYNSEWNSGSQSTDVNVTFVGDLPGDCPAPTPTPAQGDGKLSGAFSVGESTVVYFSKGNLQATTADNGATWTWAFAANQYDCIGDAVANNAINGNGTVSENGTVDLFGWSTATTKYGIHNSTDNGTYYGNFVDWSSNADLIASLGKDWRTLTSSEWVYLLDSRTTTSGVRYAKAEITDKTYPGTTTTIKGLIIVPNDWQTSYHELTSTNTADAAFTSNQITSTVWENDFQAHGAVFLPAAGNRSGTNVSEVGSAGYYWSAISDDGYIAYYMYIKGSELSASSINLRTYGRSVRLVSETAPTPTPTPAPTDEQVATNEDPENPGTYYYSTFFHSTQNYKLTNDGTQAFIATLSNNDLVLTKIAEGTQVIPANTAVILRKTGSNAPVVLIPTEENGVSINPDDNSLEGVDDATPIADKGMTQDNCYVLSGTPEHGVGFYKINSTSLKAHKAYVKYAGGQGNAPKRMRFVFNQEQTATGVDQVPSDQVQSTKVLENGVLYIIKNGVRYNAQGQIVK